ncbi:MAG: flavodoxin [Tissierellia bacterium]|nr:flavodoxin [Tissierellia bacterium]
MKVLIVYKSYHHMNTEKIAQAMAEEIGADITSVENIGSYDAKSYDVIGFGSGIYAWQYHKALTNAIEGIDVIPGQKAFSFCTYGKKIDKFEKIMGELLKSKGFDVIGHFGREAFDTFGPLKLVGGINKGRPNEQDLEDAKKFIRDVVGS